jgi:hypothetical protein
VPGVAVHVLTRVGDHHGGAGAARGVGDRRFGGGKVRACGSR